MLNVLLISRVRRATLQIAGLDLGQDEVKTGQDEYRVEKMLELKKVILFFFRSNIISKNSVKFQRPSRRHGLFGRLGVRRLKGGLKVCSRAGAKLQIIKFKYLFQSEFLRKVIANVSNHIRITFFDQNERKRVRVVINILQISTKNQYFPGFG